jgi:hypothetical protein
MKKTALFAVSAMLIAGLSSSAFADGKTHAELEAHLVTAQQHGLQFITDTSYPDVAPAYRAQMAAMQRADSNPTLASTATPAAAGATTAQ